MYYLEDIFTLIAYLKMSETQGGLCKIVIFKVGQSQPQVRLVDNRCTHMFVIDLASMLTSGLASVQSGLPLENKHLNSAS